MLKLSFIVDKHHLASKLWTAQFVERKNPAKEWASLKRQLKKRFEAYPAWLYFEPGQVLYGLNWAHFGICVQMRSCGCGLKEVSIFERA